MCDVLVWTPTYGHSNKQRLISALCRPKMLPRKPLRCDGWNYGRELRHVNTTCSWWGSWYIYIYIYVCVCVCVIKRTGTSCPSLSLIRSSLQMSRLTLAWNELRKAPYFPHVLSAPTGAIFERVNNDNNNNSQGQITQGIKNGIDRHEVLVLFNQTI